MLRRFNLTFALNGAIFISTMVAYSNADMADNSIYVRSYNAIALYARLLYAIVSQSIAALAYDVLSGA